MKFRMRNGSGIGLKTVECRIIFYYIYIIYKFEDNRMKKEKIPKSTDEYISLFPDNVQKKLKKLRRHIKQIAVGADERFSYRMPAFFMNGNLVYFAAFSRHIGFYPGADCIEKFSDKLSEYKHAKGSIRFPLDEPLPLALIKEMVEYKINENRNKK
jgi:uncharacterized protein YdhG (YjbR/CyaY superfamily)